MLAAERRRKEPRTVNRPWEAARPMLADGTVAPKGVRETSTGGMVATGLDGMLAFSQMRGAVNLGG